MGRWRGDAGKVQGRWRGDAGEMQTSRRWRRRLREAVPAAPARSKVFAHRDGRCVLRMVACPVNVRAASCALLKRRRGLPWRVARRRRASQHADIHIPRFWWRAGRRESRQLGERRDHRLLRGARLGVHRKSQAVCRELNGLDRSSATPSIAHSGPAIPAAREDIQTSPSYSRQP
jgi:hypothetical protein